MTISGRQFDKHGNLKQWWNNKTIAEFRKAAQCIVDQYSNYTLDDINLAIDGRLTQGENIADNGGLKQAYRVSHKGMTFLSASQLAVQRSLCCIDQTSTHYQY